MEYAVKEINIEANNFIYVDMYSGYWKLVAEKKARKILEFFTPDRKQQWKVILIGNLNETPKFSATMMELQMEWDTLVKDSRLKNVALR